MTTPNPILAEAKETARVLNNPNQEIKAITAMALYYEVIRLEDQLVASGIYSVSTPVESIEPIEDTLPTDEDSKESP